MHRRKALSLLEVLVTGVVLMISLPPLLEAALTVGRMDDARERRGQATDLSQLVLERIHHRLYDGDSRGYGLNDDLASRRRAYMARPPGWQRFYATLAEGTRPVFESGRPRSQHLAPFFAQAGRPGPGLTDTTHPELAAQLARFELQVDVFAHLDGSAPTDRELALKQPEEPKVDLARATVIVRWKDPAGQDRVQSISTRFTRQLHETDALSSTRGGP